MKRTTVMLPRNLKLRAAKRANSMGISLGELIRKALKNLLSSSSITASEDPLFEDSATSSEVVPSDLSKNHDKYLYGNDR